MLRAGEPVAISLRDSPSASPGVLMHLTKKPKATGSSAPLLTPQVQRQRNWGLGWGEPLRLWAGNPSPEVEQMGNQEGPHLGF